MPNPQSTHPRRRRPITRAAELATIGALVVAIAQLVVVLVR